MAEAHVSRRCELSGVTRDDLSQPVHPVPRRSEEGITRAFAAHPRHAPFAPPHAEDGRSRQNHRHRVDQRASATVEDRAVPGHWEGDLLFGSKNSQIATLVERQTRYVMLVKVGGKDTQTVINALIKHARRLPQELYKSLTWDRGKEMADHKRFTLATDIRSTSVIRRTLGSAAQMRIRTGYCASTSPKGWTFRLLAGELNAVARQLNERPRKTLNYETPAERLTNLLR